MKSGQETYLSQLHNQVTFKECKPEYCACEQCEEVCGENLWEHGL